MKGRVDVDAYRSEEISTLPMTDHVAYVDEHQAVRVLFDILKDESGYGALRR